MVKQLIVRNYPSESLNKKAGQMIGKFINEKLGQGKVLLMLSGGSAMEIYEGMFGQVESAMGKLWVTIMDERLVIKGAKESNETQLKQKGIIDLVEKIGGEWMGWLGDDQENAEIEVEAKLEKLIDQLPYIIAIAGIGSDGHTAGILPSQDKRVWKELEEKLVVKYEVNSKSDNPHRKRMTISKKMIWLIDQVFIFAIGEGKREVIGKLVEGKQREIAMPAVVLYEAKNKPVLVSDVEV